ncbi:MAG TPA: HRDC domain-containing protein [Pyrinomonadaceae bacterium]|nr:HRDC domain-containing protein [Pyrinomonadaceae bacterium]
MKCKTFKIHLQDETGNFDEMKFNKFLEIISVSQVFASVVNNEFWSVVVFYEESATMQSFAKTQNFAKEKQFTERSQATQGFQSVKTFTEKPAKAETVQPEPVVLTAEQEKSYAALRNWRNEQASQTGLAPYMIAHNDSLMQIAILQIKSKQDLLQIKGFGEKRAEKYGDEILRVLNAAEQLKK